LQNKPNLRRRRLVTARGFAKPDADQRPPLVHLMLVLLKQPAPRIVSNHPVPAVASMPM
jgi:hypothetical protein